MKKLVFVFAMLFSSFAYINNSSAQVSFSINIGNLPLWGPAGYDNAPFYYLPDIGVYYNVGSSQFVYNDGGRWIYAPTLPPRYHNYDLYNGYKVVINEPNPWLHDNVYSKRYAPYRGRHGQAVIRDSRDQKYWAIKGHPHHSEWERNHHNDSHYNNGHDQHNNDNDHHDNGRGNDNHNNHGRGRR